MPTILIFVEAYRFFKADFECQNYGNNDFKMIPNKITRVTLHKLYQITGSKIKYRLVCA